MQTRPAVQTTLHLPQLLESVCVFTSQPFAATPSQSRNPALQAPMPHIEATHDAIAFATTHGLPQPLQLAGSMAKLVHMPLHNMLPPTHASPHMLPEQTWP